MVRAFLRFNFNYLTPEIPFQVHSVTFGQAIKQRPAIMTEDIHGGI